MPEYTGDVTGLGTLRLLEAIRKTGIKARFYQASSSEMFGAAPPPQSEATPFQPQSPYAAAKVYAYYVAKNYRDAYKIFASNGILFNHESPRRGETFVTRKITRAAARIKLGLQEKLFLGNLEAKRDWGFAGDYVEAMWLMLQQDRPDDYVIATGETHSVREFAEQVFAKLDLDYQKHVAIDARYFRPTEVDVLLGDASKARKALGWQPKVGFEELIDMMVAADLEIAEKEKTLVDAGYSLATSRMLTRRDLMKDKRITITGGKGFLGEAPHQGLRGAGLHPSPGRRPAGIQPHPLEDIRRLYDEQRPDIVIHLAAKVGGIGFNQENPGSLFYENIMMGVQLIHEGHLREDREVRRPGDDLRLPQVHPGPLQGGRPLERLPRGDQRPLRPRQEDDARPVPGLPPAVRLQLHLPPAGQPLRPGRQLRSPLLPRHPRPDQEVRRCREAGRRGDRRLGDGQATREFFYVEDAAEAIVLATEKYDKPEPVNIGAGFEISIRELVDLIVELTGFQGSIVWDASKPDGQPRRMLDTTRAFQEFGFRARTDFREGLAKTIAWYKQQ